MEAFPNDKAKAAEKGNHVDALVLHLKAMADKARPKRVTRLRNFIKHFTRQDDAGADNSIQRLIAKKQIAVEAGKVRYLP